MLSPVVGQVRLSASLAKLPSNFWRRLEKNDLAKSINRRCLSHTGGGGSVVPQCFTVERELNRHLCPILCDVSAAYSGAGEAYENRARVAAETRKRQGA